MTLILLIYNFSSNPHFFFIIQHLSIETLKVFIYKASHIYFRNLIFCCIFFPEFFFLFFAENFDFFPRKISNSLVLKSLYFFFRHGKKKYSVFTHSLDFEQNCHKSVLYPGKKNTVPLDPYIL